MRRIHRDERGQSLAIILALITVLFLMGSALAAHASVALRTTVANEGQAGDLYAADAGAELGMWWQRTGKPINVVPAINVNGLAVNTTISVVGAVPCPTRTPVELTGFEGNAVSAAGGGLFSAVTGAGLTIDSTIARPGGSHSLNLTDPGGSTSNASLAVGSGIAVVRVYLRLASLPLADVNRLLILDAARGNDLRLGYQLSSNKLTLRFGGGPVTTALTTVSAGTWYRIELRFVTSTDPRSADWQIDNVAQNSPPSSVENASTVSTIRLGSTLGADAFTANYDDVFISTTFGDYPIGDGTIVGLRPDGMGTNATPGSFRNDDDSAINATTYQRIDDTSVTTGADYVSQPTVGVNDYIEVTLGNANASCVVGVSGLVVYDAAANGGSNVAKTTIVDGGTERIVWSGDMSTTTLTYKSAILTPAVAPWTPGAVDGLMARIGYASNVTPVPFWDGLLVEVATGISAQGIVTVISKAGNSTVTTVYTDAGAASPTLTSWSTDR